MDITMDINDTLQDKFLYEIDKSIESGDINYIRNAIKNFKYKIDEKYITMANNMLIEILNEKIDDNLSFK